MLTHRISDVRFPLSHVVEAGTPVIGNDEFENNLVLVEKVAYSKGLSPEAISLMLEFAMSLRMGKSLAEFVVCTVQCVIFILLVNVFY